MEKTGFVGKETANVRERKTNENFVYLYKMAWEILAVFAHSSLGGCNLLSVLECVMITEIISGILRIFHKGIHL